jgi:hypothetical protein
MNERIRRTAEEAKAGFPLELKKQGIDFQGWLNAKEEKIPEPSVAVKEEKDPPSISTQQIIETDNNRKELKNLIKAELEKCTWEWMYVDLDIKFKVTDLEKYGKQGWKLAFIHDYKLLDSTSKKQIVLCFQRPTAN